MNEIEKELQKKDILKRFRTEIALDLRDKEFLYLGKYNISQLESIQSLVTDNDMYPGYTIDFEDKEQYYRVRSKKQDDGSIKLYCGIDFSTSTKVIHLQPIEIMKRFALVKDSEESVEYMLDHLDK